MKQLKKTALFVLVMGFAFCMMTISVSAETYGDFTYKIVDDGTVEITDYAESAAGSVTIPGAINGTKVTSIASYTFYNCKLVTSITIPSSITNMGSCAFKGCTALTAITIPSSITDMGSYLFSGCTSLQTINLEDGLTTIGSSSFRGTPAITSICIPSSITSMGWYAFRGCESLVNVTFEQGCSVIGSWAFEDCTALESITIPSSITDMGSYLFSDCTSLQTINLEDGLTTIGSSSFRGTPAITSICIPSSITSMEWYAFQGCESLVNVTIEQGCSAIGIKAFEDCTALESIAIPISVVSMGTDAFVGCSALESIYYEGTAVQWDGLNNNNKAEVPTTTTVYYNVTLSDYTATPDIPATMLEVAIQYVPYSTKITSGISITSGSLPKGMGLFSDGTISGIPTQTGTFTFNVDGTKYTITVVEGTTTSVEEQSDYDIFEYVPEITSNVMDQTYHIDGPYANFLAFYINGNKMIENVEFEVEEGSTIITIFAQTFATESTGTHTISATFATDDSTVAQVSQQVTKTAEQVANAMPYTDVSESAWYYDYVYLMYRRGIIAGSSTTTYSPTSNLTRGMMVDALYQLAGAPATTTSSFSDISADAWYADAVSWAAEVGVTQGIGDNMFAPETSITREQMATMIQRYCDLMGITLPLYTSATPTDLSAISDWAVDSATAMYQYGVLNGDEAGNFNPSGTATRAEAASMFSNFLQILDRT